MIKFGNRIIKNFSEPYIIAEIASNHNGDMELAKKMIKVAKEKGADCVKFQSWTKDSIFSQISYDDNYFLADDYRNRTDYTMEEIVDKYHISPDDHRLLKKYCDQIGITFASTPFSKKEVDMLVDEFNIEFIKIASMDVDNIPFLEYVAKKGKPVVLSTGLSTLAEIDEAVSAIHKAGNNQLVLLHCVAEYPPNDEEINLNNIDMLRNLYNCPVGFSDHTFGYTAPILSIAKGVCLIEKHFTLDKGMEGWDHKISANPLELEIIVSESKRAYKMLGKYNRNLVESFERRQSFKRSIVAARDIKEGELITEADIDYKRPGIGISPKYKDFIIGKKAKRDINYDEIINKNDF